MTKYLMAASPERVSRRMKPASTYVGSDMSSNETKSEMMSFETPMPIIPVMIEQQQAVELAARVPPPAHVRVRQHDGEHADGAEQQHTEEGVLVEGHHGREAQLGLRGR